MYRLSVSVTSNMHICGRLTISRNHFEIGFHTKTNYRIETSVCCVIYRVQRESSAKQNFRAMKFEIIRFAPCVFGCVCVTN